MHHALCDRRIRSLCSNIPRTRAFLRRLKPEYRPCSFFAVKIPFTPSIVRRTQKSCTKCGRKTLGNYTINTHCAMRECRSREADHARKVFNRRIEVPGKKVTAGKRNTYINGWRMNSEVGKRPSNYHIPPAGRGSGGLATGTVGTITVSALSKLCTASAEMS
jgi:hypothetical protein